MNRRGMTITELLVVTYLLSLFLLVGIPGIHSFIVRTKIRANLQLVYSVLNNARYQSIKRNVRVKVDLQDHTLYLKVKEGAYWRPFRHIELYEGIHISCNGSPVFHPTGRASPLCSFILDYKHLRYKISLSITGRLNVTRDP
jgi:hypothetical protein